MINTRQKQKPKYKKQPLVTKKLESSSGNIQDLTKNKILVLTKMRQNVENCINKKQKLPIFNNLFSLIHNPDILTLAYSNIKSNKNSMTLGMDPNTPDEMSTSRINLLSNKLKQGTYSFPPIRRTWIPKPGKKIKWEKNNLKNFGRPISMPDFEAKIIQESIRLILDAIYEPIFAKTNANYGFRQHLGCHNSLIKLKPNTQGLEYVIEGDIKGAFNNLDHDILIKQLRKYINDEKFINLIYKCCKSEIFDQLDKTKRDPLTGVPQGGIVSPLLWNIYMQDFDEFILEHIQQTFDIINKRQDRFTTNVSNNSLLYRRKLYKRTTLAKKLNDLKQGKDIKDLPPKSIEKAVKLKTELYKTTKSLFKTRSKNPSKVKLRFYYTRYADDWCFFTNAKPSLIQLIQNKILSYLKDYLKLTLSLEKTKITNLYKTRVKYLGFSLFRLKSRKISTTTKTGKTKRVTGNCINIGIDKDKIIDRLQWQGYLDTKMKPREQPALSTIDPYELIMRYNSIIRGYLQYYAPIIDIRSNLNYFVYIFEYSCLKTLCQKYRSTTRKLLSKYGDPLTIPKIINPNLEKDNQNQATKPLIKKEIALITSKTYWGIVEETIKKIRFNLINGIPNDTIADGNFIMHAKAYHRTKFKFEGFCCICGSEKNIQMHHIKKIKGYQKIALKGFDALMGILNRKQIPVCKFHHDLIHTGRYDGIGLYDLYDIRIAIPENYMKLWSQDTL